jgi:hypothetical protein
MSELLTPEGYAATKEKYANMENRLAALAKRTDLQPQHAAEARRSYLDMMRQYLRDIKLYEAAMARQSNQADSASPELHQPPKSDQPEV